MAVSPFGGSEPLRRPDARQPLTETQEEIREPVTDNPAPPPADNPMSAPVQPVVAAGARIPSGTHLRVRLIDSVSTRRNRPGDRIRATLDQPVVVDGRTVLPRGTAFFGRVTESSASPRLKGRAVLGVTLESFRHDGRSYRIATDGVHRVSEAHKKRNFGFIGGGSALGAALGAIAGGGRGALIGAGAGAAAGTAGAAATGKREISLPSETALTFSLRSPVVL